MSGRPGTPMLRQGMKRIRSKLTAFRHASQGATAVEFGMVALPFLTIILFILFVSLTLFYRTTLDYATQKAARALMVGTPQQAGQPATQFRTNTLCPYLTLVFFDCSKLVVNLVTVTETVEPTAYVSFVTPDLSAIIVPPPSISYCPGVGSSYEVLEVVYPLPIYLSLFSTAPNVVQGQFLLMSTATFRNEPFTGATALPGC